jgi:hypothetical protein
MMDARGEPQKSQCERSVLALDHSISAQVSVLQLYGGINYNDQKAFIIFHR